MSGCRYISVLHICSREYVRKICERKRHVAASGTQHSNLSASAPFICALLCNRTVCALLNPLPTEQGLFPERLPQPYNAVCAHRPKLASIRFPQSCAFCWTKAFWPICAIHCMGCRIGTVVSMTTVLGTVVGQ